MVWTYSADFTLARDKIRFLSGDTDTNDQLLQDGELTYLQTIEAGIISAAAAACEAIAAKLARRVDKSIDGLSVSFSQQAENYRKRAIALRAQASAAVAPWAAGLSEAEWETYEEDTDLIQPSFKKGMYDNPVTAAADDEE